MDALCKDMHMVIYSYADYCFAGEKEYLTLEVLMNLGINNSKFKKDT